MSWERISLSKVAEVFNGKTPSQDEQKSAGHPVLKIKDVRENDGFSGNFESFVNQELADKFENKKLKLDDTLILNAAHNSDYVGSKQYRAELSVVNSLPTGEWLVARANEKRLNPRFLNYWLSSPQARFQIKQLVKGIHLYPKDVARLEIPLPPIDKQKQIAAILDKADAIRRKRQQAIKLADEFLRAVFLDMFGDPVENTKGWDVKYLKELSTKIHSGNTPTGGREVYVDKGIAFFRSQNVWKNKLELDDIAYLDHATHKKMAKSSLKNKDILMTKTGRINTENSSLGRAAMYLGEDDAANINGHVYLIRLKNPELNEFILFILTTREYRDYIRSVCVGGIDKRQLNKDHIEQFPIINPPVELQKQFVKLMQIVESQKKKAQQGLQESQKLFNTLSQKAFSGEL